METNNTRRVLIVGKTNGATKALQAEIQKQIQKSTINLVEFDFSDLKIINIPEPLITEPLKRFEGMIDPKTKEHFKRDYKPKR